MGKKTKWITWIFSAALLFAGFGCSTVNIKVPAAGGTLTTEHPFTIAVHSDADVSTFYVRLDGEDITDLFGTVTPGSTVTAKPPALKPVHPDSPQHSLEAHALWAGKPKPFGATTKAHFFQALSLKLIPTEGSNVVCDPICTLVLAEGETAQIRVELPEAPYGDLEVTLTPGARLISIQGQNAGEPATVIIPGNDRFTTFSVKGIQRGETAIYASASATDPTWYKVMIR